MEGSKLFYFQQSTIGLFMTLKLVVLPKDVPDLHVQRVEGAIRSGVNLNSVVSFAVSRNGDLISVTLTLTGNVLYAITFSGDTAEADLEAFVANLEKIIN
jgi:hypothetical protein